MSAITRARRLAASLLATAVLSACSAGGGGAGVPDGPPRGLAGTPASLPPDATATTAPVASGQATTAGSARPSAAASATVPAATAGPGATGGPGAAAGPVGPFRSTGHVDDLAGDEEGAGPAYADIRSVDVGDDGRNVRLTLVMAGELPARLPADETFGAGVDLFRTLTQVESDYQVFVDGSPDGWFAYLHGPSGYVRYPGTFALGGSRLVFTLPWSAVGERRSGRFSAFADWTRDAPGDNPFSEDHAPNLATASYG